MERPGLNGFIKQPHDQNGEELGIAAAKGMTLLAYCRLDVRDLCFVADKSPLKQGRLTPGHRIPVTILMPARRRPDVVLLLAWNFAARSSRSNPSISGGAAASCRPCQNRTTGMNPRSCKRPADD